MILAFKTTEYFPDWKIEYYYNNNYHCYEGYITDLNNQRLAIFGNTKAELYADAELARHIFLARMGK